VNLFLHHVTEDARARNADWTDVRDERGRVIARKPPPKRFRVAYALTAWAADPGTEHRLLGAALAALAPHETVPAAAGGPLTKDGPATLEVAVSEQPSSVTQLWPALGVPPRGRVDLAVTIAVSAEPVTDLAAAPTVVELGVDREGTAQRAPVPAERPQGPRKRVREDAKRVS
jgi:hypothetical protein